MTAVDTLDPGTCRCRPEPAPGRSAARAQPWCSAKRSLIKTGRTPEALIDVTLQPIIFLLLFVYVFGGALGRRRRGTTTCSSCCPACSAQTIAMGSDRDRPEPQRRHREGRLRPVPVAADRPLGPAGRRGARRLRPLPDAVRDHARLRLRPRLPGRRPTRPALLAAVALAIGFALCFCWVSVWVGMKVRTAGAVQGMMFLLVLPLSFGSNAFVPTDTMPGWLQAFVKVNPITHLVDAVRGLLLGGPVGSPPGAGRWPGWPGCWWSSCRSRCGRTTARPDQRGS